MIKIFHTDTHIGATNQLEGFGLQNLDPSNENEFVLGDVFDLTNCRKKDVEKFRQILAVQVSLYKGRYITGNHEAQRDQDRFQWVDRNKRVACMHGDYIFWGHEKSLKYRNKDHGAGFLKRLFWVNALEAIENGYDRKINDEDLSRFSDFCRLNGIKTLIVGHLHPKSSMTIMHNGFRLIVLKRGTTMIDIENF